VSLLVCFFKFDIEFNLLNKVDVVTGQCTSCCRWL